MKDLDAVMRAILDAPEEDLPRLAYADICEESGECERAEFIRVQIELAKQRRLGCPGDACPACAHLASRELGLFHYLDVEMLPIVDGLTRNNFVGYPSGMGYYPRGPVSPEDGIAATFSRGFVSRIKCPLQSWLDHGGKILSGHPVTRVDVMDKSPSSGGLTRAARGGWFGPTSYEPKVAHDLPPSVWNLLTGYLPGNHGRWREYGSWEAAVTALSDALIKIRKPVRGKK